MLNKLTENRDYVWYASYGSNLLYERFVTYIQSVSWGNGGVSFLDIESTGEALGRMYLVTREQFQDISRQEGRGKNWYNNSVNLGEYEGREIITFTNKIKRLHQKPSEKYLEVIRRGIKETYPAMNETDVMKYLKQCALVK